MSTGLSASDDEKTEQAEKADLEQAIAKSDKLIGEILASRYQIEVRLGEGAMGSVYKARHVKVGRPFAVKVLHKKLLEDRKVAQRFEREAELAGRLRHPNVVGVVDVGETHDGMRYMVMDFAQGTDLATLLSEAPMPAARIMHLTKQMLEGLYHAHEAGLIHRDFKPENVIVEKDDHGTELPRIVDFGIAILREGGESASGTGRLTTNGLVLGTPHYMAPEQAVADPIDHRIDLFALGIVVYEMLCGKLPFDGTGAEVARANLLLDPPAISQRVPYLEVDPLIEAFARRLMAKKRDLRPATAKAAREILDLIDKDRPAAAEVLGVPLTVVRAPTRTEPGGVAQIHDDGNDLEIPVAPAAPNGAAAGSALPSGPTGTLVGLAPSATEARGDATPTPAPSTTPAPSGPAAAPAGGAVAPAASASASMPAARPSPAARVSGERDIPTDETPPLSYEQGRRRGWIVGGVVALIAGAGITFLVVNGDKKPPKTTDVVVQGSNDGSADPTNPTTNPATTPGSADPTEPDPNPPGSGSNVVTDAGSADPESGSATEPVKPDKIKPDKKDDRRGRPKNGRNGKKDPKDVATGSAKPQVKDPPGTGSATVTPPTPPVNAVATAKDVYDKYAAVGNAIKSLQQAKGDSAVADLWPKYRLIQIQNATSTPEKREEAMKLLSSLAKTAASRK